MKQKLLVKIGRSYFTSKWIPVVVVKNHGAVERSCVKYIVDGVNRTRRVVGNVSLKN